MIDEAPKAVSFKILHPTYLPDGYTFKEAEGYKGSGDYINLYYKGSGKDIILMQRLMNEQTQFTLATDGPVEQVAINGAVGAWVEPHSVMWEIDKVDYSLFCKGFSKDEALKIARSIK